MNFKSFLNQITAIVILIVALGAVLFWMNRIEEAEAQPVKLYYYNQARDNGACSQDSVLPVQRTIPKTLTPIQDTIDLLIRGNLTSQEKAQGFTTEFPHQGFNLVSSDMQNGVLTLEFTEVPGFTDGGSCRVSLLWAQIRDTAMQFDGVKEVKFTPETLFQP